MSNSPSTLANAPKPLSRVRRSVPEEVFTCWPHDPLSVASDVEVLLSTGRAWPQLRFVYQVGEPGWLTDGGQTWLLLSSTQLEPWEAQAAFEWWAATPWAQPSQ